MTRSALAQLSCVFDREKRCYDCCIMKFLTLFIVSAILFVGLSFAGKSFFGMNDGMMMGSLECGNHCIDTTVIPTVMPSAVLGLFFIIVLFAREILRFTQNDTGEMMTMEQRRRTEPIRLFLLSKNLATVFLRD